LACIEWPALFPSFFEYWTNSALSKRKSVILCELSEGTTPEKRSYRFTYF
jgi:hypothetical protein